MIRWVNFYPPCDYISGGHPWRTTSWHTRGDADRHAREGRVACVMVEFELGDGLPVARVDRYERALRRIENINDDILISRAYRGIEAAAIAREALSP